MPKQIIIIMNERYPFGECEEMNTQMTKVLVRKIYPLNMSNRQHFLEKVSILRKLKNEQMIKIESILQEEESVHFLFEYVPIKVETWISNINDQFIENFRDQVIKFSSFLANNCIKIDFEMKNIGMDANYRAKYYLDLDFQIDPSLNKQKLKSSYIRQISNFFKPYITKQKGIIPKNQIDTKSISEPTQKKQNTSISPPTNTSQLSMSKQNDKDIEKSKLKQNKPLPKYYTDNNISMQDTENQKILQQFMDVLEGDEEEGDQNKKAATFNKSTPRVEQPPPTHSQNIRKELPSPLKNYQQQKQPSPTQQKQPSPQQQQVISKKKIEDEQKQAQMREQTVELQNRVKSAIEKSLTVIKKFKNIKEPSVV